MTDSPDARYLSRAALLVVDVQNDFASSGGSLYVQGGEEVVAIANREIRAARAARVPVVYTQDWHPAATPHFATHGGVWPEHCVRGTWGAELHPGLLVAGEVVRKGTGGEDGYSGFTVRDPVTGAERRTRLAGVLHGRGVTEVVIVGLATDYCVRETAFDAARLGFRTTVLLEGVRAVDVQPGDGDATLAALATAGVTVA